MFLSDNGGCHEGGPLGFDNRKNGLPPGGVDSYMSYGQSWANVSNAPFRKYKHWVHEGGIATPLVAHWPAAVGRPGTLTHETGHVKDIMATCLDVAEADYPTSRGDNPVVPLEGRSLAPAFRGEECSGDNTLFWEHEGNRAVRDGQWKLVADRGGPWELYDMQADRTEMHDLDETHPDRVAEMSARYEEWANRVGVVPWDELTKKRG
jgi:arylsulfatase